MGLYLIEHTHTEAKCPTRSPEMVRQLSQHLTDANAAKFGVKILADWVNDDDHRVVLILEAPDQSTAMKFVEPFGTVGSVTIHEGTTCAELAQRCLAM
jgi:uncharacterized protein with GYD domain